MKTLTAILIAILVLGVCQGQTACPTDNKFLQWLKNEEATAVRSTVLTGSSFEKCNEVWITTGTCCELANLKPVFEKKMKDQKDGFDKFIQGLKKIQEILDKLKKVVANKDDAKTKLSTAFTANSTQFEGTSVDQALQLLETASSFATDIDTFKKEGKGCFDSLTDASGKVFCYGCVGTTTSAFNNDDGSTSITQASCNALLDKCFFTWGFIQRVGGMMQVAGILNHQAKADAPPPKVNDKPNFGGVSASDMLNAYMNCKGGLSAAACTDTDKANLCKANYNIQRPPKKANDDNLKTENVSNIGTRRLQGTSVSSGEIGISPTGADLTKTISPPTTSSTIDASGSTSSKAKILQGFLGLFALLALLN